MCVSVVVLKRTQDNSTTPFFSLKKKSNDRRSRGRIKRNGKRKEKKMVQEMLSFLEGRFGGQSFWWGVGAGLCCWTWKLKHNPQCLWGFLWRERNACCFDRQDLSVAKLKYLLLKSFNEWKSSPMSSLTGLLKYLDFLGLHLSFVVVFISYFSRVHSYLEWV